MQIKNYLDILVSSLKGEAYDYTQGSINKAIVLLAIPMILELSLESVFALVDIFFVARLGESAIATVGFTESIITIVYSAAIGLSTGATALIARRTGEKNKDGAAKSVINIMLLAALVSLVLGVLGVRYAEDLLRWMGADEQTIAEGSVYTKIMFGSNLAIVLLFVINGIFRGSGDASMAMRSLWIASIINIILDPILIYGIGAWAGYGLKGAAIATVIGRSCGVMFQVYALLNKSNFIRVRHNHLKLHTASILKVMQLSWPATIQFIIASGSWILLTRLIAQYGGITAAAGYQIAIRNIIFFILPAWGLSNAAATLVGQNLGANQADRAERSVMIATKYNLIFMGIISLIFVLVPRYVISMYTQAEQVMEVGVLSLRVIGAGYIFYGLGMVMMQSINGAGDTRTPTIINFIGFWMIQIPLAYVLGHHLQIFGVLLAIPIAEGLIGLMAYWYFKSGRWRTIQV